MKSATRSNSKYERFGIWSTQFGGAAKRAVCPGCQETTIEFDKYKGWEAAHIMAHAKGNGNEGYNMFPLCAVCNKRMGTRNMFCFFWETQRIHALRDLIHYERKTIKANYPSLYSQCRGQMWDIAHRLFINKRPFDGGIPKDHAVWEFFMREDIKQNNAEALKANEIYQEKRKLASEISEKYTKLYLPKEEKTIVLPSLSKRQKVKINLV